MILNREEDPTKNGYESVLKTTAEYAANLSEGEQEKTSADDATIGDNPESFVGEQLKGKTGVITFYFCFINY